MKISDLAPNDQNPRTVTDAKLKQLKKALNTFGDLSGVVFNRKTRQLVGGHQRLKHFDPDSVITVVKKYSKPTKTGTVSEGFVELKGERFSYREVYWDEHKEKAANIAANKGAGEWDEEGLALWLRDLAHFDLNFDMDLTMFDTDELTKYAGITVREHTRLPKDEEVEEDPEPPKCKAGEVYALGKSRLLCGEDDLHYCDLIISRWEKYSGEKAIRQRKVVNRKNNRVAVKEQLGHA